MPELINIYRKNTSNVGDHFTTPTRYFEYLRNVRTLDITELPIKEFGEGIEGKAVIFGGGGFIAQEYFKNYLEVLLEAKTAMLIGWALGHNTHGASDIVYGAAYRESDRFDLLGVRDSTKFLEWVPCPSCMHGIFDQKFETKNEYVIYEHKNFPMRDLDLDFPRMKNNSPFEEVIKFLGSAEMVVTNSYHGAYWATLLKKRVLVMQPFSTKFFGFRHPLIVANNFDIKRVENVPIYPEALHESRAANVRYSKRIQEILNRY